MGNGARWRNLAQRKCGLCSSKRATRDSKRATRRPFAQARAVIRATRRPFALARVVIYKREEFPNHGIVWSWGSGDAAAAPWLTREGEVVGTGGGHDESENGELHIGRGCKMATC